MERLVLEILPKSDYEGYKFKGITKKFYGSYPYKVKLANSNINIGSDNRPLYDWFTYGTKQQGEDDEQRLHRLWNVKFVNAYTRHVYFREKNLLDMFMSSFSSIVEEVQGPVSQEHIDVIEKISNTRRDEKELLVIRDRLYYQKYNARITFNPPPRDRSTGWRSWSYSELNKHYTKLQDYVEDILGESNVHKNYNNVYLMRDDYKEVAMYMKLKYPNSIRDITEVIVIENLNNR